MGSFYRCLGAASVSALTAFVAVAAANAADPASLIVIVDSSRSMWGPLDGNRQGKYLLVRDALRAGFRKTAPQTRVGLASFGHRRGDCADVEVVRPPEPLDVDRIMVPLEQLTPRGVGPLTLALREAAKLLPRDAGPRSLLLIHDDADNCQVDLCAAAAELRAAGITAHVVGLGVKSEDMAKMACLPHTTGGRHFNAQNAEQVVNYIDETLRQAGGAADGAERFPTSPSATAVVPPAPIPASGPPALHLNALLAPNTEPLGMPLQWTIAAESQPELALFDARAVNPVIPIRPGRYVVEVRDGPVFARQAVEVRENRPTGVTMVLNAATVRVRALAPKSLVPLPDAIMTVSDAAGSLLLAWKTGDASALLPAGRFSVRAELGLVRAEQTVTVTAGRPMTVDVSLNAARLQLMTAGRDGSAALEAPVFSIVEDDPDAPRGRREMARSATLPAEFVLPPGTYYVIARQGIVETRERLAIGPGDVIKRTLVGAAGRLGLSTKTVGLSPPASEPISYTIARIDGVTQDVVTTSQPSPTLLLPSGRYRVEGRYGLMNVRTVREIEIRPGQTQQLLFEHQAASLKLRVAGLGLGPADISWDIRDEAGRTVWTGGQPEAIATLQAGRYMVRAETREKRHERSVELRAGETKLVEFSAD